ncbi:Uu.00g003290.m01.CDS01 [Anthostomella pinea]|uniref:Uu.00g003290.m01.CDS01 n=1 Tax=Anthostomella pinea TaxID=933095 RepID=A0AAI8VJS5_9PEZI|nr:Uu.00g003290.m01.CDS01 [Anthostomella pinea]
MATFYEQRMFNLFERYGISKNAQNMLKQYEDFMTARVDEAAVGRLIRLSPNNRAALTTTMGKCAKMAGKEPGELKHCLAIIDSCVKMLQIADKSPVQEGFPSFKKLPSEIRNRIFYFYLGNHSEAAALIPFPKHGECVCAPHEPPLGVHFIKKNISAAFTSKAMRDEVLACLYRKRAFHFPCACEMHYHLTTNDALKELIRTFHWCGIEADKGIRGLQDMKQLEYLTVIISKSTTKHVTQREKEIRKYFMPKRGTNVLPEALGFDELIQLRGLSVAVEHVAKRKADRRSDDEKGSLNALLQSRVTKPREDSDEETG